MRRLFLILLLTVSSAIVMASGVEPLRVAVRDYGFGDGVRGFVFVFATDSGEVGFEIAGTGKKMPYGHYEVGHASGTGLTDNGYLAIGKRRVKFSALTVDITKVKGKTSFIVNYEAEGRKGGFRYTGRVKAEKDFRKLCYEFERPNDGAMNYELTGATISICTDTLYNCRKGLLLAECGIMDFVFEMRFPTDSSEIYGRYEMNMENVPYRVRPSEGVYYSHGKYAFSIYTGGDEEWDTDRYFYFPQKGYIEISEGKIFFELTCHSGQVIRGVYKGEIKVSQDEGGCIDGYTVW